MYGDFPFSPTVNCICVSVAKTRHVRLSSTLPLAANTFLFFLHDKLLLFILDCEPNPDPNPNSDPNPSLSPYLNRKGLE